MAQHLEHCSSCLRYKNVVEQGRSVLLSLPVPELGEDFSFELEHRLARAVDDTPTAEGVASRAPALAVFGIAVLLSAVAWAPMLRGGPAVVVELEPIVVDHAPTSRQPIPTLLAGRRDPAEDLGQVDSGLWEDLTLYEFSPLSRRYPETLRTRQVGLQTGR